MPRKTATRMQTIFKIEYYLCGHLRAVFYLALLVARDYWCCLRWFGYFFILELYDPIDRINLCERARPRDVFSRFDALALSLLFEEYEHGDYRRFDF